MDKAPGTTPVIGQDIHRDGGFREGPPAKQPAAKPRGAPGGNIGQGAANDAPAGEEMSGEANPGLTIAGGGGHA